MNEKEKFACSIYKAYLPYSISARDGTKFIPTPVSMTADRNITILRVNSDGSFHSITEDLFACLNIATRRAVQLCIEYENQLKKNGK